MGKTKVPLDVLAAKDMKAQKYSDAIEKYTQLLEARPEESTKWLCERGERFLKKGSVEEALEDGKNAKKMDSTSVEACVLCGRAETQQGNFMEALDYYKEGLKIDPGRKVLAEDIKKLKDKIIKEFNATKEPDSTYSALKLSSQAIYPGDDKLLQNEKEILQMKYKILDDPAYSTQDSTHNKDVEHEAKVVQGAYHFFHEGKLDKALDIMSKLIKSDPKNIFYRTFRAQIYFNMGQWSKVIQDYFVIPKPYRKPEIWRQGGMVLAELWLPVNAEFWLRKATQLSEGKDEEAALLFQQVRVKREYDPLCEDHPITVEFTQFGRAVHAKEDIPEGGVVMTDIPLVIGQLLASRHIPACSNCAVSLITPEIYFGKNLQYMSNEALDLIETFWPKVTEVWCEHCGKERYCSKACKTEAWDSHHQVLCPKFNKNATKLYEVCEQGGFGHNADGEWVEIWGGHYSPMILAKIWGAIAASIINQMKSDGVSQPTVEHYARAKAPYRRFIAFGTTPAVKRLPHALALFQSVFSDCGEGFCYKITEEEFNGRYYQAACNLQSFSPTITPYHKFLNNIKGDIRAVGLLKFLSEPPPEAQFAAMCPLHACCNHSCINNAEVHDFVTEDSRPALQIIAKRKIKKGEEIFITYIDTTLPKTLRKAWLYKSFNFWCQCQRCTFEGESANVCTGCQKEAEEDKTFAACSKCKKAWYCGTSCQREHWKKGHKIVCQTEHSKVDADPLEKTLNMKF